jgi:hypothetical protein
MNTTILEKLSLQTKHAAPSIGGRVVIRNPATGKILHSGDNLVVLAGRAHALQMLCGLPLPQDLSVDAAFRDTEYHPDKRIALFQVGIGGVVSGSQTDVVQPEWSDWYLKHPVPFVVGNENHRPFVHFLQGVVPPSLDNVDVVANGYYGKTFDKPPELRIDNDTNRVYMAFDFSISPEECRGYVISEIGLFITRLAAGEVGDGEAMELLSPLRMSMFSRYVMNPRDFTTSAEGYDVEYQVYC